MVKTSSEVALPLSELSSVWISDTYCIRESGLPYCKSWWTPKKVIDAKKPAKDNVEIQGIKPHSNPTGVNYHGDTLAASLYKQKFIDGETFRTNIG